MENFHCIHTEYIEPNKINNQKTPTNLSLIKELMESNEKDLIISNQKTYIYQLELKEKEFDNLNQKFFELKYEYDNLDNYKNQLEIEIRNKDKNYNNDISILRAENESLQLKQNEILRVYKQLQGENDYLKREIEIKQKEIQRLNQKLNELLNELNISKETYMKYSKENEELNNMKLYDNNEISNLLEDNHKLYDLCQKLNDSLKESEAENAHLKNNIENLNVQLNIQDKNIKYYNEQININSKMQNNLEDINSKMLILQKEKEKIEQSLLNEENQNKNLNNILLQKEEEIKALNKNNEELQNKLSNLNNDVIQRKNENEKYINKCNKLKEQNDKLMNEISNVITFNQKFKDILNRKEKLKNFIENNNLIIQDSLKNIELNVDKETEKNIF